MRFGRSSRLRLRTLSLIWALAFGLLAVGSAAGLTWSIGRVTRMVGTAERLTEQIITAGEIDRTVREYHRLGTLTLATEDPQVAAMSSQLESELRAQLGDFAAEDREPATAHAVGRMIGDIEAYMAQRAALMASGLPLAEYHQALRAFVERALTSAAEVQAEDAAALEHARSTARRALDLQRAVALGSVLLLVGGFAAVALGARRLVGRPIQDLDAAMMRFRRGDADVSVSPGGVTDVAELASSFNEMAQMILQQRREQLTFIAGVAHDLRNPLAVLKAGVEALAVDPSMVTPERFRRIDRQIDALSRMVGDLLDSTRIEAGELRLQCEDLDLRETAQTMVELFIPTTMVHQLVLHLPASPVVVHGDPLRLEQVIGNLLSNAIKYSPSGGRVEVSVTTEEGCAHLTVTDQGDGVPPEELPSLFLPFRRRRFDKDTVPGVGLGLSVTRRIVQAHGGRIDVESTPGTGATFCVRLPLSHATEERELDTTETTRPGA